MEPGGIADEMKALAAANPDVMKLEQYGTSTLGKPLYTIKMTANARNVADGTRPAILFSAVNHAREWIAAEMGRRLPVWFAEHKNDPEIARLISDRELWFVPIQNPDGYDFTFTCGTRRRAGAVRLPQPARRQVRQPLLAQDAARQRRQRRLRQQPGRRRPEPQLPVQARHRRGRRLELVLERDLPRPVRAVGAREPRHRPPAASRRLRGQHQLPLRRPAAADPGVLQHRLLAARLDAVRRHHRHRRRRGRVPVPLAALLGPLRVQRRHDRQRVHELRHHRLDAGDGHVRHAR